VSKLPLNILQTAVAAAFTLPIIMIFLMDNGYEIPTTNDRYQNKDWMKDSDTIRVFDSPEN